MQHNNNNHSYRFDGRVAIITGAASGLGRAYAMLMAKRGALVVVNDLANTESVVAEIKALGGAAAGCNESVLNGRRIVECALDTFSGLDIVINNAGILRDRSFANMSEAEWDAVIQTHLLGSYRVTRAAWPHLRAKGYGRVIFTASGSGLYGWYGQANYAAAKMGCLGLANVLAIEGKRHGVHVNTICPIAGSALSATVWPDSVIRALSPDNVAPVVAYLCHESCPTTGGVFEAGGGWVSALRWQRTSGAMLSGPSGNLMKELAGKWRDVLDFGSGGNLGILDSYQAVLPTMPSDAAQEWAAFIAKLEAQGH
ncbi:MAG: serine/threonine protein kinase [Proteobacteria bacterium]|nr:MAG: serine/threonine protein kinase [Pseudomonadota bacterium]